MVVDFTKNKFLSNEVLLKNFVTRVRSYILQNNHLIDDLLIDDYITGSKRRFFMVYYSWYKVKVFHQI